MDYNSFDRYVNNINISVSFPSVYLNDILRNKIDIEVTLTNEDIGIQYDDGIEIESEFGDFFN